MSMPSFDVPAADTRPPDEPVIGSEADGPAGSLSCQEPLHVRPDLLRSVGYVLVPQVGVAGRGAQTTMS